MANVPAKRIKVSGKFGSYGENGATFTPHVSEDGTLSWTNDKEVDNPTPVNIRGPKGDPGETKLPDVTDDDNGKMPIIRDGKFVYEEISVNAPVFNLVEMGMPPLPMDGTPVSLQIDPSEIITALSEGPVVFIASMDGGDEPAVGTFTASGFAIDGEMAICCCTMYTNQLDYLILTVIAGYGISAVYRMSAFIPPIAEADNDKILQVVNGAYSLVAVKDSAVATFINDYINEVLGGEY